MHTLQLLSSISCATALAVCDIAAQCGPIRTAQSAIGGNVASLAALTDGRVAVGGWFVNNPPGASRVAIFDPTTQSWDLLAGGCNGPVQAVAQMPNGDLIAAGRFSVAGGVAVDNIARWNGSTWTPLAGGGPPSGVPATIYSLLVLPNGDLLAGGDFAEIEGTPVQGLARWDGTTWTSVGYPYLLAPVALTLTPNGDLIVVDLYAIERLSGGTWSIEAAILGGYVNTATTLVDGTIVFAGNFSHLGTTPAMNVAQLRGGTWSALGGGVGGIASGLTQLPDGDLVVVGDFDHAFDGGGAKVVDGIARWDGQQWTSFAGSAPGNVQAIVRNHDDSLTFAGFLLAGSGAQNRLATIRSACPAQASSFGLGCAGSAGTVTLAAESRPWLGGTYAARASGLPAAALGVSVLGFAPSMLPLATVLPASANCFLFSTADQLELSVPGAGVLTTHLPIPDSLALTGATFRQQVLTIELGSAGIVDVSASNGLLLTIGSL